MADTDSTEQETQKYAYEPHTWHRTVVDKAQLPGGAVARFANHVVNISGGLELVSGLLAENQVLIDHGDTERPPILSPDACNMLQRLITANLNDLQMKAQDLMTWAYEQHTQQGRDERRAHHKHCATARDL
jgi:hypothetical protein